MMLTQMKAGGKENYVTLSTSTLFQEGYILAGKGQEEIKKQTCKRQAEPGCECLSMVDASEAVARGVSVSMVHTSGAVARGVYVSMVDASGAEPGV